MQMTETEIAKMADAYWDAVERGKEKLAEYIRNLCWECGGVDVAEE